MSNKEHFLTIRQGRKISSKKVFDELKEYHRQKGHLYEKSEEAQSILKKKRKVATFGLKKSEQMKQISIVAKTIAGISFILLLLMILSLNQSKALEWINLMHHPFLFGVVFVIFIISFSIAYYVYTSFLKIMLIKDDEFCVIYDNHIEVYKAINLDKLGYEIVKKHMDFASVEELYFDDQFGRIILQSAYTDLSISQMYDNFYDLMKEIEVKTNHNFVLHNY